MKKVEEVIIKLDFPTNSKGSNSALHFRMIFLLIVREVTLLYISGSFINIVQQVKLDFMQLFLLYCQSGNIHTSDLYLTTEWCFPLDAIIILEHGMILKCKAELLPLLLAGKSS
jgi:hypothetical protein